MSGKRIKGKGDANQVKHKKKKKIQSSGPKEDVIEIPFVAA